MSVTFAAAIACVRTSANRRRPQHRRLIARVASGRGRHEIDCKRRFTGRDSQPGDRLVQQAEHLAHVVGAITVVIFWPGREPAASVDRHGQSRFCILRQDNRIQRLGDVARERGVVGLALFAM
jgi:hypothetical protein